MSKLQAPLGKNRQYLGIAVRDCTLDDDGTIHNASGAAPFHIKAVELADITPAKVAEYRADYMDRIEQADAAEDPAPPAPKRYLSKSGNLIKTAPATAER